ncbi:cell surface protein, partial [Bacillus cereus]
MSTGLILTGGVSALADEHGATYNSNAVVEFSPDSGIITPPVDPTDPEKPTEPTDPTNPEEKPNPGTEGPLSIDFASSLDFGVNKISNKDETYYANAQKLRSGKYVPNYVQISDTRGVNDGWTLTVQQEGQLSNATTQHKELTGSQIKFVDPTVTSKTVDSPPTPAEEITLDPSGAESLVMSAEKNAGSGLWVDSWGTVEEMTGDRGEKVQKTKAISLSIPGQTPKDAVKYST